MQLIDTHIHLDGAEFAPDLDQVMTRAAEAGVVKMMVPATNLATSKAVLALCGKHSGILYPMAGLHPEEVDADFMGNLSEIRCLISDDVVAIGEVGLDFYWSREYEKEQLRAFEEQVRWSVEMHLPLMIHCRKAQNEMLQVLRPYRDKLPGGVFHCFTGNLREAQQLLSFPGFALGIGGVLTFKKSPLPELLPHLPIDRIVLETDGPYMAPVPVRGQRNESAYLVHILSCAARALRMEEQELADVIYRNVERVFAL